MARKPNVKCEICGKGLYRRPCDIKKYKFFCCKGCRSKLYKKHKNYSIKGLSIGRGWNKGMSKAKGDKLSYGRPRSKETRNRISKALKKAKPINPDNHIIVKCIVCGVDIHTYKNVYIKGGARFCSRKCSNIRKNKNQKTNNTDIEQILEVWLKENNVNYIPQKEISGITIPDFFVEPNICIYADGDYWHTLPKVKKRDRWINQQLKKKGYKVIRLWGSEIKKGVRPNGIII